MTGPRNPDDLSPAAPADIGLILDRIKIGVRSSFPFPESTLRMDHWRDHLSDRMVMNLTAELLAERLPDQTLRFTAAHPRWATWWDHLKATHGMRWWAAWWVRKHPPRYIDEPVPVFIPLRSMWVYPHAPVTSGLGRAVLRIERPATYWGYPQ